MKPTLCQLVTRVTDRNIIIFLCGSVSLLAFMSISLMAFSHSCFCSFSPSAYIYMPLRAVSTVTREFPEFQKQCTTEMFPSSSRRISKYILGVQKPDVSTDIMQTGTN